MLIALFTYRSLRTREVAAARVTQTLDAIQQLEALHSELKDAETGQRGFLLTGAERYLEPYTDARAALAGAFAPLRQQIGDDATQNRRIDELERLTSEKTRELAETIELARAGNTQSALAVVRTDRGKAAMDRIRTLIDETERAERAALALRQDEWQRAVALSSRITWGGSLLLLLLISSAAIVTSRQYQARETEIWIRAGQAGLSQRIQGEQRLDKLGDTVLEFLAAYLNAQVGAIYIRESDGGFRRFAWYAVPAGFRGCRRPSR